MARLVVVSNRVSLPRERTSRAGGLAIALREVLQRRGGLWFGWSGETAAETSAQPRLVEGGAVTYALMDLDRADHRSFYVGYANSTLWPLCHYRLGLIEFRREDFEGYQRVNARFAEALRALLRPDDLVWVHDYHFIPLGRELRRLGVGCPIGYFQHIPFPAPEVLSALPDQRELLASLAHYDLVGFQTEGDLRCFRASMELELGALASGGWMQAEGRRFRAMALPVSIDVEEFRRMAEAAETEAETARLVESLGGRRLVIGVDRLDYSKGLPNRFAAYGELLQRFPEYRTRVTFLQVAPTSRDEVPQYRALRRELEALAGRINSDHAEFDWIPLRYLARSLGRRTLAGFYRQSHIGMVTPLRDGMNLVAKEYVAAQRSDDPGVLILSRFAGAARELGAALIVNPYDSARMAESLHLGLSMALAERRERWQDMMTVLRRNSTANWQESFLAALAGAGAGSGSGAETGAIS
ncbi:MAG: trehalose-6-phosphate synthase [Alphaproteobacteria bacterium]|nr:trehalose-6-phosphate synthase [Alphaproteobacteria bacterium]